MPLWPQRTHGGFSTSEIARGGYPPTTSPWQQQQHASNEKELKRNVKLWNSWKGRIRLGEKRTTTYQFGDGARDRVGQQPALAHEHNEVTQ